MRPFFWSVLLLAALTVHAQASDTSTPVLTLLYSANSYGVVNPCPS